MNKTTIKVISIILTIVTVLMVLTVPAFAENYTPGSFTGTNGTVNGLNKVADTGNKIITVIRTVGMIVAVVILMVLGIKYMMGSAEEKASYKKTMMPYIVGAILIFGASALAQVIYNFATGL